MAHLPRSLRCTSSPVQRRIGSASPGAGKFFFSFGCCAPKGPGGRGTSSVRCRTKPELGKILESRFPAPSPRRPDKMVRYVLILYKGEVVSLDPPIFTWVKVSGSLEFGVDPPRIPCGSTHGSPQSQSDSAREILRSTRKKHQLSRRASYAEGRVISLTWASELEARPNRMVTNAF